MEEVHLTTIKPKNNVLLLAQEISFAKVLACNDKRLRDRGVRRLKKWLMSRSQGSMEFTKDDFMRIWKGLFYCMWMSDKPLVQEDLAEEISNLIHSFASFKASLLFVETFFASLSVEWGGIDQLRLDKFLMLVRRFLRQSFELVARLGWREEEVQQLADVYHQTISKAPMGLSMHVIEVFFEELAKVGKGELTSSTIMQFITIFAKIMTNLSDGRLISQITRYVFLHLIRQTELGIEHQMKFSAWKEYGFPGGDVDAAEKIELDSDDENSEGGSELEEGNEEEREVGVDARAGKVDVLLPPLDFDTKELLEVLRELRNKKDTTNKARKTLIQLISKYENLAAGKYPLGLHKVDLPNKVDKKKEVARAAKRLLVEEEKLYNEEDDEIEVSLKKRRGKKNKASNTNNSVWKVSESNESTVNNESNVNSSWEVSETESKCGKKKHPSKKRKLEKEEDQSSSDLFKKLKVSQFSVSKSKENSFSSLETSTPKTKNKLLVASQFSVGDTKENSLTTPKRRIQQNKIDVLKKVSPSNGNISTESSLTKDKSSKNKKKKKQTDRLGSKSEVTTKTTSNEIQIPEIDSTTNTSEASNNVKKEEGETLSLQINTSTIDKNNGWGGEWDDPSENMEYEIFIPNKKYVAKRKSLGLSYPISSFVQKSAEQVTPVNKVKRELKNKSATPNSQKKVEFNLSANRAQDYKEYAKRLKSSKNEVLFDATKKPIQGLLKNSTPSPINPFYKKELFLETSTNNC